MGSILFVDLSQKKWEKEEIDVRTRKEFLGGIGFNAKLAHELIKPNIDPLSPENYILIGAGALTGTGAPATPKTEIAGKSPLTGTIGTALAGHFGFAMKMAGYEQMAIGGRAAVPVYLKVFDDEIEILEAGDLWGKDIYTTTDILFGRHKPLAVAAIGPAGENLVSFSLVLINKIATWGRGGFGAIFGSKNLKAIVIHGTKGVKVADSRLFSRLIDDRMKFFLNDPMRETWSQVGTMVSWESYARMGNLHHKNWGIPFPKEKAIELYGIDAFKNQVRDASLTCPSCPLACKHRLRIKEGEYSGLVTNTSCNLGAAMAYGINCEVGNYNRVTKCHDLANRYGLDNLSMGNIISFLVDLYERGIIDKKDTNGLELKYDFPTTSEILRRVTFREGFGDIVADGWKGMLSFFGDEIKEYAVEIRGLDPPFEPRVNLGTENLGVFTCPRGGHAVMALSLTVVPGRKMEQMMRYCKFIGVPEGRLSQIVNPNAPGRYPGVNVGRLLAHVEDYNIILSACGICNRPPISRLYDISKVCEFLNVGLGLEFSPTELKDVARKIIALLNKFNIREGISRKNLEFPKKWIKDGFEWEGERIQPLKEEELDLLLDEYYDERGWDVESGEPKP